MARNISETSWNDVDIIPFNFYTESSREIAFKNLLQHFLIKKQTKEEELRNLKITMRENLSNLGFSECIAKGTKILITYRQANFEVIAKEITTLPNGWECCDTQAIPASYFISQTNPPQAIVLRNIEKQLIVIILQNTLTIEYCGRIISVLYKLTPWLVTELTKGEVEYCRLLSALNEPKNAEKVIKIMEEDFIKYGMRDKVLHSILSGYENIIQEKAKRNLSNDLAQTMSSIEEYTRSLNRLTIKYNDINAKLNALNEHQTQPKETFADFIISHSSINHVKKITDEIIHYAVCETIEYYDIEEFKRMYETKGSYFYKENSLSKMFYEMFVNDKGHFVAQSEFQTESMSSIEPVRASDTYIHSYSSDALPHPHLARYACLGGNQSPIAQFLQNNEWDMAIEQTIAATKNINFSDGTVMNYFINYISDHKTDPFILADNGKKMSVAQFMRYIKKEETSDVKEN